MRKSNLKFYLELEIVKTFKKYLSVAVTLVKKMPLLELYNWLPLWVYMPLLAEDDTSKLALLTYIKNRSALLKRKTATFILGWLPLHFYKKLLSDPANPIKLLDYTEFINNNPKCFRASEDTLLVKIGH